MSRKNVGSSLDDYLRDEGYFDEAQTQAIKEVIAWQLEKAMKEQRLTRAGMARLLKTSRTQIGRLLDPACDVTISSLQRAAALTGRRVRIDLVKSPKVRS
jgi:predicted XRE-type DNA-binding protein